MELSSLLTSVYSIIPELILVIASLVAILVTSLVGEKSRSYGFAIAVVGVCLSFFFNLERFITPSENWIAFDGALSLTFSPPISTLSFLLGLYLQY